MRVIVVTNPHAGTSAHPDPEEIRQALQSTGVQSEVLVTSAGHDLASITREAIKKHPDAIVASGGDGTVSSVAGQLAGAGIPLGVLPTGTLNHFAKDLGLPLDLEAAAKVIAANQMRAIDLAEVNGRVFINNSSIGIYPQIVAKREEIRERLGRGKWVAMLIAFLAVFRRYPTVHVRINSPKVAFERDTPFVFIGNNRYEFALNMLGKRPSLDRHKLSVYFTNRTGRFGILRLSFRALIGRLNQDKDFNILTVQELLIETNRPSLRVALDGEVFRLTPPLHYRTRPDALKVIAPPA